MTIKRRVFALSLASIVLLAAGQLPPVEAQAADVADIAATFDNSTDLSDADLAAMDVRAAALRAEAVPLDDGAPVAETAEFDANVTEPRVIIQDRPARLSQLVARNDGAELSSELKCLATAVYFEARGEPLEGQLAVAQVILNRVATGRFAPTICGVVYQPGQFTFAHSRLPATTSLDWKVAQAIAVIAASDEVRQVAPRAISFHAARLTPGWTNLRKVSQIGNHVFYR